MTPEQVTAQQAIVKTILRNSEGDYDSALHHLAEQLVLITSTSIEDRNRAKREIRSLKTGV